MLVFWLVGLFVGFVVVVFLVGWFRFGVVFFVFSFFFFFFCELEVKIIPIKSTYELKLLVIIFLVPFSIGFFYVHGKKQKNEYRRER